MTDEVMTIVEFSEDISEAEAPEPLPVGEYPATIRAAEVKLSQRGTKYAAVTFAIAVDEYPADYPAEHAPDGTTVIYRRVGMEDTPAARFGLRRFCEAIGAVPAKKVDVSEWVGLDAVVEIDHDEYEGINRANIVRVNAA